jgi:ankyrin repeat protein
LPKTLEDTYLRILESIDEDYSDIVQKLLKWLVRGTREMSLKELASAVAIDPSSDNEKVDPDDVMDPEDVVGYCGSLITVSDDQKVSLTHFTVKEFLTSDRIKETLRIYHVGLEEVHAELAEVCLTYLEYRDFDRQPLSCAEDVPEFLERFNFLEYASKSWAIHAHQVSTSENLIHGLIEKLFHSENQRRGNYDLWLQMYFLQNRHGVWNIIIPPHTTPLYYASYFGLPKIVESLLDEGADPKIGDGPDDCLSGSSIEGHSDVVDILLKRCYEGESKDELKRYLYLAASRGHRDATEVLLGWGAPIESSGGKYGTALQVAALEGHPGVVNVLLKRGADFKVVDARFGMPLSAAAEKGHRRVTQLLLEAGAPIDGRGGWFSTPLISAIVGKDDFIINKMLDNGANVNIMGGRHGCALMAAAAIGKVDLVKKLIDLGAKVNDENDKGADALHSACCAGRLDVVELLLASGADVNAKGGKHRNALNAASAEGYIEIVQRLLAAGADSVAFDSHYGNALQAAAFHGHKHIVRILAEAGINVNVDGGVRGSALVSAAASGSIEMIDVLVSLGVPSKDTQDMRDALIIATRKQHEPLIRHLIHLGANVNGIGKLRSSSSLWSPLALASHKGNEALVETLLSFGANANSPAGLYGTALIAATDSDHCNHNILERLLSTGANINEIVQPKDNLPFSAISAATRRADLKALTLLLDHGADINVFKNSWGTPLMDAVWLRNEALIDLLLDRGADVNLCVKPNLDLTKDTGSITAIDTAAELGHVNLIYRLVKAGAFLTHTRTDTVFKTALHCAAYHGQPESIKALLELGVDVNAIGGVFGSALQAAAATYVGAKSIPCMELLLDAGANINEHHIGKVSKSSSLFGIFS